MKPKSIFTISFGILILFLHHSPTVAKSCQALTGKCSTTYCGNGFTAVAWDVGCNQMQYCCIASDEVHSDDIKTLRGQGFRDRFDGIQTSSHYKREVFVLAQEIKDVLDAATESSDVLKDLKLLKSKFPVTVRNIVWGDRVALFTKRYNEYLYAYYDYDPVMSNENTRRRVHTWRPGGVASEEGYFEFDSKDGGNTFLIKNTRFGEYLYAYYSKEGKDLRDIYTWKPPCDDKVCFWQIEYMGGNEIRIMNAMHPEYLVAAGDSLARDNDRRNVFTGMLGLDERIWKVVMV